MPPSAKTFETYLGCDNCGHEEVYQIPVRRRIIEYASAILNPDGTVVYSAYERPNGSDYHPLICIHCELPCLRTFWWKDQLADIKEEVPHA